ncbi:MAG TPA: serine hydrolase domain-containing protein [Thermoanaerobaculia bacterium]|jgi:CubicO group peptidase (beta-lactamase class C family)
MRHRLRVLLATTLLLTTLSAFGSDDPRIAEFEAFVARTMAAQQMPGLSVAVSYGDFRWERGFGFADLEHRVPATAETSYRMASVTKPMTAVAVLKLMEEGKLDLDAEVQTYVEYFPRKPHPVTVRQLLGHQGGISHYRDYNVEGRIREPKTTRESVDLFGAWELAAEPGTKFLYSSYGYNLLGAVVEGASGQPYGVYLRDRVWVPLGMTSTRLDDPRGIIPNRAEGYVLEEGTLRRSEYVDISSRFAGGGTRSTVGDMLRLVEGLAAGKVLSNETRELAWTRYPTRDGRYTRYDLGFGVYARNGRRVIAHSGSQQETRTNVSIVPSERFAVALASNFENADLSPFEDKLFALFLGDPAPVGLRAAREEDAPLLEALQAAYSQGLAYYDRYGKPMTTDRRELAAAFRFLRDGKNLADGAHPVTGEPLVKIGSYIASILGDADRYHRAGALRFFADYARATRKHKLDAKTAARVRGWSEAWTRVWTPELAALTFWEEDALDVLERNREALLASPVRPDLERRLAAYAEHAPAKAERAKALSAALYPK